jgi:dephospho-CoA kinase
MFVVGLTGGIGSGKSTFAALLAEQGARVVDADLLGREALQPGRPAWHSVVDQFGDEVLAHHSLQIDRKRLAEIVFADRDKLAALNAIVHPVIMKGIADTLDKLRNTDEIVILDAALILELGLSEGLDALVVVVADESLRKKRLAKERGMSDADIVARMRAQASPEEQEAKADLVVRNNGNIEELTGEAERVWLELSAMASGTR